MNQRITATCSQIQDLLGEFCRQQNAELTRLATQMGAMFAGGGQLLIAAGAAFQPVAQLLSGHFTYRLGFDRPVLPAVTLGSDQMLLTAMMNAGQFDQRLVRHYRSLGSARHLLLILNDGSPSNALQLLRDEVMENEQPVALLTVTREQEPLCRDGIDICLELGTDSVPRQLELTLIAGQLLCELVESELFGV